MSTYELTRLRALRSAHERDLIRIWDPPVRTVRQRSAIYGASDAIQKLERPWGPGDDEDEVRRQVGLAACAAFVSETTPLQLLFKIVGGRNRIAELRVLAPKPGLRLVGGFMDERVYIILSIYRREEIAFKRNARASDGLLQWQQIIEAARTQWETIFGEVTPVVPQQLRRRRGT
jgi:hypothetical protein